VDRRKTGRSRSATRSACRTRSTVGEIAGGPRRGEVPAGRIRSPATTFRTDASINPGNSGGPAARQSYGRVVGVKQLPHFYSHERRRQPSASGFAIPINTAKDIGSTRDKDGRVTRGPNFGRRQSRTPRDSVGRPGPCRGSTGVLVQSVEAKRAGAPPPDSSRATYSQKINGRRP
jgi:S1-C subfamily serine protease